MGSRGVGAQTWKKLGPEGVEARRERRIKFRFFFKPLPTLFFVFSPISEMFRGIAVVSARYLRLIVVIITIIIHFRK